ncbi:MAG: Flp pilus assembly complex ATPase component TadA [Chthonomonas sp.]|nr:Flp pilus assembly complex ATPase component TadA [Chthonomonas sp.]
MAAKNLGDLLVSRRLITPEQLAHARELQRRMPQSLGTILVSQGVVTQDLVLKAMAAEMHVGTWDLNKDRPSRDALSRLPASVCRQHRFLPVQLRGDLLILAMHAPTDADAIELAKNITGLRIEPVLAASDRLDQFLETLQEDGRDTFQMESHVARAMTEFGGREGGDEATRADLAEEDTRPVVGLVNEILTNAIRMRASDIHLDPLPGTVNLRFRMDGQLITIRDIPSDLRQMLSTRIKIMAGMDIVETRLPQDGRISVTLDGRSVDLRVSSFPSIHGERMVMRVLDRQASIKKLDDLGFDKESLALARSLIHKPYGLFLVTGPTGSGKTTTLYAALQELRNGTNNIMTCEDPVEYEVTGIAQSQVNEKVGLTFAEQLRAILRQDPDVILVGEIRDQETAETAIRASLTGHMVFATLHCNDALAAVPRLLDMGVEPYLLSTSLVGVMAQRLVRSLCPDCKEEASLGANDVELFRRELGAVSVPKTYTSSGCESCYSTGFRGRQAVIELLPVNATLAGLIAEKARMDRVRAVADECGYSTLQQDSLRRVLRGETSLDEARRVVFFDSLPSAPSSLRAAA